MIAGTTGWPMFGDPPPPDQFRGPDGIEHTMVYRVLRTPGGIEDDWAVDDGYRLALLGPHDADVGAMWAQLRGRVRSAIANQHLERAPHRDGWVMRGKAVEGRLVWRDDRPGYDVVVDGRRLTWEEFGDVLEPFEAWTFRLTMQEIERAR